LGPSAGGLIIAYIGIAGCFLVNAISFVFLLFNLYMMELPPWEKRTDEQTLWADVKEGFNYLLGNQRLLYIVGLSYVIATFCAPYNRFVPIFATNVLHVGASGFGLLMAAPGVGATVAALVLASVKKLRVGISSICYCAVGFGLCIALFAFSHYFVLSFFFLALVGFCQIAGRALSNTAIQTATPTHLLGRVLSLFFMDRGLWSLGSVIIGAAGAAIGMDWTFTACGAITAIAAVTLLSVNRKYRAELARQRDRDGRVTQPPVL
jgi:predicted MFS family arabinose efflux permease